MRKYNALSRDEQKTIGFNITFPPNFSTVQRPFNFKGWAIFNIKENIVCENFTQKKNELLYFKDIY